MRIVSNLSDITECPNCGSIRLYAVVNRFASGTHLTCIDCHEEIREDNIPIDNSMVYIPQEEAKNYNIKIDNAEIINREQEEKEQFLFNLREEIDRLRYNIHDTHSMMLVNKLTDIFTQIADYIENH